jgi:hypothetical protein
MQLDLRGNLKVSLVSPGTAAPQNYLADNTDAATASGTGNKIGAVNRNTDLNGSTWTVYATTRKSALSPSAARTTRQTSADQTSYNGLSALIVVLDVTSAGTGSIRLSIEGKDPASRKVLQLLSGLAATTDSANRYRFGPTLAVAANSVAQDYLPRTFRITVTANSANSVTYSVGLRSSATRATAARLSFGKRWQHLYAQRCSQMMDEPR